MATPWHCHGVAMTMPWNCHGIAIAMPSQCHGNAIQSLKWKLSQMNNTRVFHSRLLEEAHAWCTTEHRMEHHGIQKCTPQQRSMVTKLTHDPSDRHEIGSIGSSRDQLDRLTWGIPMVNAQRESVWRIPMGIPHPMGQDQSIGRIDRRDRSIG